MFREFSDDPVKWLSTPVDSAFGADWWAERFLLTYGRAAKFKQPVFLTLDEYTLNRWLWVTNGATKFSKALLDNEAVKTKLGAALSLTDEELLSLVHLEGNNDIGIFIKPDEMGYKRRLIASVSLGPYIIASYVRYLVELGVGSSPLFAKLKTDVSDTIDVMTLLRHGSVMMPLDESAYDYHVSRESWLGFFDFLNCLFPDNSGVRLLRVYFDTAVWSFEGDSGRWLSGMPSGLALTSFLNSWMNYIKQDFVSPGELQWAAGDDVLVAPYFPKPLTVVEELYAEFGSSLNAQKNWISTRYAEYLKVLYHDKGTTGYPARIYASLIWAGVERSFLPSDRLPELAELFKQFYDRLGLPLDERLVCNDLSRAVSNKVSGFNSVVAREWLHSPRAYGGFGRLPYNDVVFDWKLSVLKKRRYTQVIMRVPDVNFYDNNVELVRRREPFNLVTYTIGAPLRLPPITSLSDWERRLNGEDNPVKGKFGRMALDVIPLPSVDFISTSNMARFAANFGYNVFPNIRSNGVNTNSRLISASLGLVDLVRSFMDANGIRELSN